MIDYLGYYDLTYKERELIYHTLSSDILDLMLLNETNVRKNLDFFCELGLKKSLCSIILNRPDLIIVPNKTLKEVFDINHLDTILKIMSESIDDLIMFGV